MSVVLLLADESRRAELPEDPLATARTVLAALGANPAGVPSIGRQTEAGFEYAAGDVEAVLGALDGALSWLELLVDEQGEPRGGGGRVRRNFFKERQALRAALALFLVARERGLGVRVSG